MKEIALHKVIFFIAIRCDYG